MRSRQPWRRSRLADGLRRASLASVRAVGAETRSPANALAPAVAWALSQKTGSTSLKCVLQGIAAYAGEQGECFPSIARIASEGEMSMCSARRALIRLERLGLIARFPRFRERGGRTTDLIVVLHGDLAELYARSLGWLPPSGGDEEGKPDDREEIAPSQFERAPSNGDDEFERAPLSTVIGRSKESNNHLIDPQTPVDEERPEGHSEREQAKIALDVLNSAWKRFSNCWAWKETDVPESARKVFFMLSEHERGKAIEFGPRYVAACRRDGAKIGYARKWLSSKGWEAFERNIAESAAAKINGAIYRPKDQRWTIYEDSPQAAAWAKYEIATKGRVNFKVIPRKSGPGFFSQEHEWPPMIPHEARDHDGAASHV